MASSRRGGGDLIRNPPPNGFRFIILRGFLAFAYRSAACIRISTTNPPLPPGVFYQATYFNCFAMNFESNPTKKKWCSIVLFKRKEKKKIKFFFRPMIGHAIKARFSLLVEREIYINLSAF